MVQPCSQPHFVVAGFKTVSNFWDIICTGIDTILKNIPNGTTVNIGGADGGKVNVVVNGKITQTEKPTESNKDSIVTVELLEEILKKRVPNIHMGYATGKNNSFIYFPPWKFKTKPTVIVMPTTYTRWTPCKREWWKMHVSPGYATQYGFWFNFAYSDGWCGGWYLENIAYIAIENIDPIFPISPASSSDDMLQNVNTDDDSEDRITKLEKEIEKLKEIIKNNKGSTTGHIIFVKQNQSLDFKPIASIWRSIEYRWTAWTTFRSSISDFSGIVTVHHDGWITDIQFTNWNGNLSPFNTLWLGCWSSRSFYIKKL